MKKLLIVIILSVVFSCKKQPKNTKVTGVAFGSTYSVIYDAEQDYERQFDSIYRVINQSMSKWIPNSTISKLNRNELVKVDEHFATVFEASKIINKQTKGAFDPTISAVVDAWDFGPEGAIKNLDSTKIKDLMAAVGIHDVYLRLDRIEKENPNTQLDFNAIGKGYGLDVVADFMDIKNVQNYLIEIGGEIRCKGKNVVKNKPWRVGIDKPNFDGSQSIMRAVNLNDESMATSGTYRKFKVDKNGNRYTHIIDAISGYPSKTNILSVSVIATDCMVADAYATAFQAMGIEKTKAFLKTHPELKAFIIYNDDKSNELQTMALNGFPE